MDAIGADRWYETLRMADGVTLVHEPWIQPFFRCNIWHVRGRDRDLLFDSGLGHFSLRGNVPLVAERPLVCVASHTHFDHIGCHHEFPERCVHRAEAAILADPRNDWTLADRYATDEMFIALPQGWDSARDAIPAAPAGRVLEAGDVIDLGDRAFEVLHLPGHSPGSLGLWEAVSGTLFSGDAVYDGPLLDQLPGSDIARYLETMKRLRELPVSVVHAGHDASFGRERLRELADAYLSRRG
jgi:glyoxylase-like metal-dependent hydrolase (beta-lactamase superfamily II)